MVVDAQDRAAPEQGPEPKAKGIREPAFISRQPATFFDARTLNAEQWRRVIGQAPVVRACIQTLVMQITGLLWRIETEDEKLADYFTLVLNGADDGAGFENMVARVVEDALSVPFGGAWEIGSYRDGTVAWLAHLDAALMLPTYDKDYPYAQASPWAGPFDVVRFQAGEVSRVMWQPQTSIKLYGWTRTPAMDCLPAIQGLLRSDRFWQSLLTDSPPAGILDVLGWSEQEALDWLESWKTMMAGVDSLKVPILYGAGREKGEAANFISFGQSATEAQLPELVKRYAEMVCAAFGMNVGDLGLFGQELRLAGATKLIELSKRQGLAHLLRRIKQRIDNDVLPDDCEFAWEDVELEDTVRRATAKKVTADALAALTNAFIIGPEVALAQAVEDGIITVEAGEPPGPPEPAPSGQTPTGDESATTAGKQKGDEGARHRPFGAALLRQGAGDAEPIPPRAYPTTSKAARELGKIVGPWLANIARTITPARIGALLDAGLAAAQAAGGAGGATATITRARTPSPAEQAIEALLKNEDWWRAPNVADRVQECLNMAYAEGLVQEADAIQEALYTMGAAASPHIGITVKPVSDPAVLAELKGRAYGLITNVDSGTDYFIRREIMAGVREGIHAPAIARKLLVDDVRRGVIETFRGRALSIVNTEVNWAMSQAALKQQQHVGLKKRRWRCIPAVACDICKRNANKGSIPASSFFDSVWGPCHAPPAHPQVCHCWITFDHDELRSLAGKGAGATPPPTPPAPPAAIEPPYYTGQPAATGVPPEEWTDATFVDEFRARYGYTIMQPTETQADVLGYRPFTLDEARLIGRTIEAQPRVGPAPEWLQPPTAGRALQFKKQVLSAIERDAQSSASGFYNPATHSIHLAAEYLDTSPGSLGAGAGRYGLRFVQAHPEQDWNLAMEIVAHEYGHAYAAARYGHWNPLGWGLADQPLANEVRALYQELFQEFGTPGIERMPTAYARKNAGEYLAESMAGFRYNGAVFAEKYPRSFELFRRVFGWDGYVIQWPPRPTWAP